MNPLIFEGASDDTFGEYGRTHIDHDDCAAQSMRVYRVDDPKNGDALLVTGQYAPKGIEGPVWVIGIAQVDENVPLPPWPVRFKNAEAGYTPSLEIDAPEGVSVELVHPKGERE